MPGYVIHLCIAKEYARKHKVENEEEFVNGTIYPDSVMPKGKTHYSEYYSNDTNLYEFLKDKNLNTSYNEGYFLHLLADCLFYNKYFTGTESIDSKILYNDYDVLNSRLVKKYNLKNPPKSIEEYFYRSKEGQTVKYHFDKVVEFIEDVSNFELHKLAEEILQNKDYKFLLK